jgi:hypothetical protein
LILQYFLLLFVQRIWVLAFQEKPLGEKWKRRFQRAYDQLGSAGERVLGI